MIAMKPRQRPDGTREYDPRGGARALWFSTDPSVCIVGPANTGKTRAVLEKLYWFAETYPESRILIVRKTRASMTQSVLNTFERYVVPDGHPMLSGPKRSHRESYVLTNGSEIVVGGLDNPDRIMSTDYDMAAMFEATECEQDDAEKIGSRLNRNPSESRTPYCQLVMDTNPGAPSHWIRAAMDRGAFKEILSRHADNPACTQEYIDTRLKTLTGHRYARLYLGQWAGADGMVYDNWDRAVHVRTRGADWKYIIGGVDEGYGEWHPFCAYRIGVDPSGNAHVLAERRGVKLQPARKLQLMREILSDAEYIAVDSAAPDLIDAMRIADLPSRKAIKDVLAGIARVTDRLAVPDNGMPGLTIDPSCSELIREIESYEWEPSRAKDTPKKKNDHGPDAIRYAVMMLDEIGGGAARGRDAEQVEAAALIAEREERSKKYGPGLLGEFARMRADNPDWGFQ